MLEDFIGMYCGYYMICVLIWFSEILFVSDYVNVVFKNVDRVILGSFEIKEVKYIFVFLIVYGISFSLNIEKFCYFKL